MQEEQFLSSTSPRPFSEIPGLWVKVTQMTEEFLAEEAPRASASNVLIGVLIFAVASTILSMISTAVWGGAQMAFLPPEYRENPPPRFFETRVVVFWLDAYWRGRLHGVI